MKNTRTFIATLAVASCAALTSNQSFGANKPNVIVFLVDDMGIMDTSVPMLTDKDGKPKKYPLNEFYRTPGMERLAAQGIRFNQFCAQSVCSPSRTSIVTGQNATRHRTTTWINPLKKGGLPQPPEWNWEGLKKGDVTLQGVLKDNGYRTIHVGKAHFGPQKYEGADPTNVGFEVNIAGDCWGRPKSYLSEDHYGNHPKYQKTKKGKPVAVTHNIPHLEKYYDTGTFLTEALTIEAKDQIRKSVEEEKPFFLHMSHYAVHGPFDTDKRFINNYKASGKSKQGKAFAALIEGMDKSLNDIMDELESLNIAENTLIIFLGDNGTDAPLGKTHGIACAAPLRGKKATHYEGGMRIPFIAAWAKPNSENKWQKALPIAQNVIQTQMGTIMDIYPTVLELTGVENPAGHVIDGSSLKTLFTGKKDSGRAEMFLMHFPHKHRSQFFTSFRLNNWKVIYHYNPEKPSQPKYELFDLKNDPFENDDQSKSNPERLTTMMKSMVAQLEKESALYPVDKDENELKPLVP